MINKIVFTKEHRLELPPMDSLERIGDNLSPDFFLMKEDPYYGIDSTVWRRINTKYMCYQEKEKIFFYYSRAFIEGQYSGRPIFPYFKGRIEDKGNSAMIKGRLKYQGVTSFFLPVVFLGMILLVFSLKLSPFFLTVPALLALMIFISARNFEKEMIGDLKSILKKLNLKKNTTANIV